MGTGPACQSRDPGQVTFSQCSAYACSGVHAHAGLLALRTAAITATFALATALAARTDVAHAAGHQICLQLWLASSLLADALAVAAQTLVARLLASQQVESARVSWLNALPDLPLCRCMHMSQLCRP